MLRLIEQIAKFNSGELSEQQSIEMFSQLLKHKQTHLLNGLYSGTIDYLLDAGILDAKGNILERV